MSERWRTVTLGEMCEMYQPKTISKKMLQFDGKYPVYGANGVIGRYNKFNHEYAQLIVTCRGATCGSVNISQPRSWINGNAMVIQPKSNYLITEFLKYFFIGGVNFSEIITGSAQPQITRTSLIPLNLPLPTLDEQKEIVEILDQAFESIEKAKANIEKNVENAKELFQSKLNQIFSQTEGWEHKTIGDVCDLMTGGTPSRKEKKYFENGTINWLVSGDINKKIINDCEGKITENGLNNSNAKFLPINSVMIAHNGQGKTRGSVAKLKIKATCNQSLVSINPIDDNQILSDYIYSNLNSRYIEIRKMTGDSGNDRRGLNMPLIRSIKISFPQSIEKQKEIIEVVEILDNHIQSVLLAYDEELQNLEELKKSILQKAFSGELTNKNKAA